MKKFGIVTAVLFLFIVTFGSIFWLTVIKRQEEEIIKDDPELRRMMRSLDSIQENIDNNSRRQHKDTDVIIHSKLPWLPKHKTVSNFYLRGEVNLSPLSDHGNQKSNSKLYSKSSLVFVHFPRSAGSNLIKCLNNISFSLNLPMSPLMDLQNRILWDAGNPDTNTFKDHIKIHRGKFSFGMCEKLKQSCSYFMLIRDPFTQSVSSYKYCKKAMFSEEQCSAFNANEISLRDWIIGHESVLFNRIVFSPHFCNEEETKNINLTDHNNNLNTKKAPCWYKQKLLLEKKLTSLEKVHVTNYIIENLGKWFSVIGIFEELGVSLKLFQRAFNLPFTRCNDVTLTSLSKEENTVTNSARYNKNDNRQLQDTEVDEDNDIEFLQDDDYVKDALSADYRIYKEAKRIFHIQKQVLLNTVAS